MFLKFVTREGKLEYGKSNIDFDKFYFFTYSREAIYQIAEEVNLNNSSEVIVPNYICNTVIDILFEYTKNIKFYKIDKNLKFDDKEIKGFINKKTKMILFVDYFGVETVVNHELVSFIKDSNIIIIKDSAHSFLTLVKNNFNSSYKYDYMVSSIYKNLPLGVGAIATGNFTKEHKYIDKKTIIKRKIIIKIKNILCFLGINIINKNIENLNITTDKYIVYNGKNYYDNYQNILNNINYDKIISNRDNLALDYYEYFKENSLFELDEIKRSSLQVFPIWCSSKEKRDQILNTMRENCIDAFTWATFHKIAANEYLWEHILLLPLNDMVLKLAKEKKLKCMIM